MSDECTSFDRSVTNTSILHENNITELTSFLEPGLIRNFFVGWNAVSLRQSDYPKSSGSQSIWHRDTTKTPIDKEVKPRFATWHAGRPRPLKQERRIQTIPL